MNILVGSCVYTGSIQGDNRGNCPPVHQKNVYLLF